MDDKLTVDVVGDFPGVVQEPKLVPLDGLASFVVHHLVRDKVFVLSDSLGELDQEGGVADLSRPEALLVQHGDDALVTLLHQVADDLVVKVLHGLPLHRGEIETVDQRRDLRQWIRGEIETVDQRRD